jgi:aminopeptidase N
MLVSMRVVWRVIGILAIVARAGQSQSATPSDLPFRPVDYDVRIDLPDSGVTINGDATLTLTSAVVVDTLKLDLIKLHVQRVDVDRRAANFARTDSTIVIPIPRNTPSRFTVRVVYDGPVTDGLIARRDSAGRWTYFGDNWPNRARYWIPSIDRPDAKATVSWTVTAPPTQTIVANGKLVESRILQMAQQRRVLSRWRESKPIAPYLMVIAAAPLTKLELGETACGLAELARCVPQSVYVAPEQRNILPGAFAEAGDIVQFYASLIAPFPYEKLAHLQSETRYGGMENASAIFYADALFHRNAMSEGLIAHETAHQWFGDAVTERTWPHVWLSEGFATYFAALYTQHAHGDSAFRAEIRRLRDQVVSDTVVARKRPVIDTTETDLLALLNVNSYQKGALVLHMLRSDVGDSAFFRALRDYYSTHKDGNADTDDLRQSFERVTGKDWRTFFNQWLRRPGYPQLNVTWSDVPQQGTVLKVFQFWGVFGYFEVTLPVVVLYTDGTRRSLKIPVAGNETTLRIDAPGTQVQQVLVDPDATLLFWNMPKLAPPD